MIHTDGTPTIADPRSDRLVKDTERVLESLGDRRFTYGWEITYRHSTQGFGRTLKCVGKTLGDALVDGIEQLETLGYADRIEGFEPTSARRGAIISLN